VSRGCKFKVVGTILFEVFVSGEEIGVVLRFFCMFVGKGGVELDWPLSTTLAIETSIFCRRGFG
jgi:hypothetical protein